MEFMVQPSQEGVGRTDFKKYMSFPGGLVVKNPPASARDRRDTGSTPRSGRSLEREWQPTPVFLPGESHGQRSLTGYSPWGHKESDTTEVTVWHRY